MNSIKTLASWLDPFFLANTALRKALEPLAEKVDGLLLDIGCGQQPHRSLFKNAQYFGLEVATQSKVGSKKVVDAYFDGLRLPLADNSVDALFCSQVLEHVFEPDRFLKELSRVVKPNGTLILTVPFVWDEHEQPFDFARYSSFGLRHLASKHGFKVSQEHKTLAHSGLFFQLWLAYLQKVFQRYPRPLASLMTALMSFPLNLLGKLTGCLLPTNPDLYLDNVMVWTRCSITDDEMTSE